MPSRLVNLVKINVSNSGTGAIALGAAAEGHRGVEVLTNGMVYSYSIQQGGAWEFGRGTFLSDGNQLIRSVISSSDGGTPIALQATSQVAFTALAEDLANSTELTAEIQAQVDTAVAAKDAAEIAEAGAVAAAGSAAADAGVASTAATAATTQASLAAGYAGDAQAARDVVADLVLPQNKVVGGTLAAAEALFTAGTKFAWVNNGLIEVRERTVNGSTFLLSQPTAAALASPDGAGFIGYGARTVAKKLEETVSIKDSRFAGGAAGDGSDATAALEAALLVGGIIECPNGIYRIKRKLYARIPGTRLRGSGASWGDEVGKGVSFLGDASLVADFLIEFSHPNGTALRSMGMTDIGIDLSTEQPDCGGLCIRGAYDASAFKNINITGVALGREGLVAEPGTMWPVVAPIQTSTFENIYAIKRTGVSTTATVRTVGMQECTLTNVKAQHTSPTHAAWEMVRMAGCPIIAPSFVNSTGLGVDIISDRGEGSLSIINPTYENCKQTIRVRSVDAYMFGTFSPVPAVGDSVRQPADGSAATGVVWQASAGGVYVTVTSGTFAGGTLYSNAGASIGTVTSIDPRGTVLNHTNPRTIGAAFVAAADGGSFSNLRDSYVELPNDAQTSVTHQYTTTDTVINTKFVAPRFANMAAPGKSNAVVGVCEPVYTYGISWPWSSPTTMALNQVPANARRIRVVKPGQADGALVQINGFGQTVSGYPVDTNIGICQGSVTLTRVGTNVWSIENANGNIFAYDQSGVGIWRVCERPFLLVKTASFAADSPTIAGATIINEGAAGLVNIAMSAIGAATRVGTRFTLTQTTAQTFRMTPAAGDQIYGSSAAGKYISLDSLGASVTLEVVKPGFYAIVASSGTFTFAP